MAVKMALMVSVDVHRAVKPEDIVEIAREHLEGLGQNLDVRLHYVLPDATETAAAREARGD